MTFLVLQSKQQVRPTSRGFLQSSLPDFSLNRETKENMAAASSSSTSPKTTTERRGIPAAQFVEDVETYLSEIGLDVNSALAFLQERSLLFISISLPFNFFSCFSRSLAIARVYLRFYFKFFFFLVYIFMLKANFCKRVLNSKSGFLLVFILSWV